MNWITESQKFDEILLRAKECKYVDSGRRRTSLVRLVFDDAGICTELFFHALLNLMRWSRQANATYVVLDPDPVNYFHRHFGRYPALEFNSSDTAREYLDYLNDDPGGSPADAVAVNWNECAIFSPSDEWFIHALRDEAPTGGHIWLRDDWSQEVIQLYPQVATGAA